MDVDYEHRMRFERVAFCFAIYPIMSAIPNTPFSFFSYVSLLSHRCLAGEEWLKEEALPNCGILQTISLKHKCSDQCDRTKYMKLIRAMT
jgi:hypothetical protein